MKTKVMKKQGNSRYCVACGIKNPFGFEGRYYETDSHECVGIFETKEMQQSYPGRVHGGVITAMLDETIGRAIWLEEPETWGVTVELDVRYLVPVPIGAQLKCVGRITKNNRRLFEGTGEVLAPDGTVLVSAWGKYWKMTPEDAGIDATEGSPDWFNLGPEDRDPAEIELPDGLAEKDRFAAEKTKNHRLSKK